jgi:hypothetical protein
MMPTFFALAGVLELVVSLAEVVFLSSARSVVYLLPFQVNVLPAPSFSLWCAKDSLKETPPLLEPLV